ncbi:MAG TPA: hypothetical protein DCQ06_05510, partial [Myxococcales bacterium]|nr:hypothetical protein [Myxococcales bacterium]
FKPRFDPADLAAERRHVLADRAALLEDDESLAYESLLRFVYRGQGAGRSIQGNAVSLGKIEPSHCRAWLSKALQNRPIRVGVSTSLSASSVHQVLHKHAPVLLNSFQRPKVARLPAARIDGRRLLVLDHPGHAQATIALAMAAPAATDPQSDALALADLVIGGMFSSRLNYRIRDQRGWAYSVQSSVLQGRQGGLWVAQWSADPKIASESLDLAMRIVELAITEGLTDGELNKARGFHIQEPRYAHETPRDELLERMHTWRLGLPQRSFETRTQKLTSINKKDVKRALRSCLNPGQVAVVVIGDAKRLMPSLAQNRAGFAIEVIALKGAPDKSTVKGNVLRVTGPPTGPVKRSPPGPSKAKR